MIVVFLKFFFHLLQNVRIAKEFRYSFFFVSVLFFIGNAVFHSSPEVHRNRAQLNFYRIVFASIQTADIYSKNQVVAAVAVRLGIVNVVAFTDENKIRLFFYMLQHNCDYLVREI